MKFSIVLTTALIATAMAAPVTDSNSTTGLTPTATGASVIVNGFAMPSASATNFAPAPDVSATGSISILGSATPSSAGDRSSIPSAGRYLTAAAIGLLVPASASFFF